ncbi:hypothetical protein [Actinomadura sp. 21ATH]|uniref:hypothetical protein n=1 Tax=Actinomadura sp. 21ATH TaxID=1735444 RepID=UPI0035C214DB
MEISTEQETGTTYGQNDPDVREALDALGRHLKDTTPRFYAPHGAAFGHQASTVQFLKRLIALGVVRKAELVYTSADVLGKLRVLLPQIEAEDAPPPFKVTSEGRTADVALVRMSADGLTTPTEFAISGGWDYRNREEVQQATAQLRAGMVLIVQPYGWEKERSAHESCVYLARTKEFIDLSDALSAQEFRWMLYSRPRPRVPDDAWEPLAERQVTAGTVEACRAVLDAVRGKKLLCPAYGVSDVGAGSALYAPPPASFVFNLAGTFRVLQGGDDPRFRKGAVILVLCALKPATWTMIKDRFGGGKIAMAAPTVDAFVQRHLDSGGTSKILVRESMRDPKQITDAIGALKADEVLILNLVNVPHEVFDLIYAEATLPSIFEGAATAGMAIPLGNPFFRFVDPLYITYPVLPLGGGETAESRRASEATKSLRTLPKDWPEKDEESVPPKVLAEYVRDAYTPGHAQYGYFRDFGPFLRDNPKQEKLNAALLWLHAKKHLTT